MVPYKEDEEYLYFRLNKKVMEEREKRAVRAAKALSNLMLIVEIIMVIGGISMLWFATHNN